MPKLTSKVAPSKPTTKGTASKGQKTAGKTQRVARGAVKSSPTAQDAKRAAPAGRMVGRGAGVRREVARGGVAGSKVRPSARGRGTARDASGGIFSTDEVGGQISMGSLSPLVDVIRDLGNETEGIRGRQPRVLTLMECQAIGMDGIGRNACTAKVAHAMAPGYKIVLHAGIDADFGARLVRDAGQLRKLWESDETVKRAGYGAFQYGASLTTNSWVTDAGVSDLALPYTVSHSSGDVVRWTDTWDRRDLRVASLAASTTPEYRSTSEIALSPWYSRNDYDRIMGGYRRGLGDSRVVNVHPSRYVYLSTPSGFSIFQQCIQYLSNLILANNGATQLMQRAGAGVFEVSDWDSVQFANPKAKDKFQAQFQGFTSLGTMILQKGKEEFSMPGLSLAGIDDGIYGIAYLLAASLKTPMVYLLMAAPGQFNSGDVQKDVWYGELDTTRSWLEPTLRYTWDLAFEQLTGGPIPGYDVVWNPYEPEDPGDNLDTKTSAFTLAEQVRDAGFFSQEAALAGLSASNGKDFDMAAARAVPVVEAPIDSAGPDFEVGKFAELAKMVLLYQQTPGLNPAAFRTLAAAIPAFAAQANVLFPDVSGNAAPAGALPVAGAGGATNPGVAAGARGPAPAPSKDGPAESEQSDDEPADEAWLKPREIGSHYSIGPAVLAKMRTPLPGQAAGPGQIEWLQTPAGHYRYRKSDVEKVLRSGVLTPIAATEIEAAAGVAEADALDVAAWVARGMRDDLARDSEAVWWTGHGVVGLASDGPLLAGEKLAGRRFCMIRLCDESGVSGVGVVMYGVLCPDGEVVTYWVSRAVPSAKGVYSSFAAFEEVHISQHPGNGTIIAWEDECEADGHDREKCYACNPILRGAGPTDIIPFVGAWEETA